MFKFLKDKLKQAVSKLTTGAEKEAKVEEIKPQMQEKSAKHQQKAPELKVVEKPVVRAVEKQKEVSKPVSHEETKPAHKPEPKKVVSVVIEKKESVSQPRVKESALSKPEEKKHSESIVPKQKPVQKLQEIKSVEPAIVKPEPKELLRQEPKKESLSIDKPKIEVSKEPEKKGFFGKMFGKKDEPKQTEQVILEHSRESSEAEIEKEPEVKKGFFGSIKDRVTTVQLSEEKFNELFWDLELGMLESSVALEVIEKIKLDLKDELTTGRVQRKGVDEIVHDRLEKSIEELFVPGFDLVRKAKSKKPFVIAFIGVNGSGKTTTLAKVARLFQKEGMSVVIAASDTFRAAAIQQLEEHAKNLDIKMIKHDYGSDPAAVAYDAISHAKAKGIDVVLVDTAGRLHSNDNLMKELHKLIRVNQPDLKLFVGEAITGNDCVEQAKIFDSAVGIDGIILAKADVDEKGGSAVSISFVTGKPILFLGTGQTYDDLTPFKKEIVIESIGL